jgi:hypothetical protein
MDALEPDYTSLSFPSNASPFFPESEWEDARRTLPEDVFRQEYMAEFLEDSAGVFRNVDACLLAPEGETGRDRQDQPDQRWRREKVRDVVVGCDVAKHTDFTVLIGMDAATGRCFAMERFNHLDWPVQKERILSFARNVCGRLILDATGVGDPIYDDLKRVYPDVEGFKLTNASKTQLIQRLIVAVEQRKVCWPGNGMAHGAWGMAGNSFKSLNVEVVKGGGGLPSHKASDGYSEASAGAGENWAILTSELKRYEYAISPTGVITYNAPAGYHDDCVIALALANWRRWESENVGRMMVLRNPVEAGRQEGRRAKGAGRRRGNRVLAG